MTSFPGGLSPAPHSYLHCLAPPRLQRTSKTTAPSPQPGTLEPGLPCFVPASPSAPAWTLPRVLLPFGTPLRFYCPFPMATLPSTVSPRASIPRVGDTAASHPGKKNSILLRKRAEHSAGPINNEMIQQIVKHDQDMAHNIQDLQQMAMGRELSGKPVIWEPLVHAPLQTAAATTNVAIALTHQHSLQAHIFLPPSSISSPLSPEATLLTKQVRRSQPSLGGSRPSSVSSPSGVQSHLQTPAAGSPSSPMVQSQAPLESGGQRPSHGGQPLPRTAQKGDLPAAAKQAPAGSQPQLSKSRGASVSTSLLQQAAGAPSPSSEQVLPAGRTLHYSLSRATGSHISLLMQPQQLVKHRSTQGLPVGRLTQDVRLLSASQPSLPNKVAQQADGSSLQQGRKSAGNLARRSSPSVAGLLAKPCPGIPGQPTHSQQMPSGSLAQPSRSVAGASTPQSPVSTSRQAAGPSRKGSVAFSPEVETGKPKLPSNM